MKKWIIRAALLWALTLLACTTAFASSSSDVLGIQKLTTASDLITLTPLASDGTAVSADSDGKYEGAGTLRVALPISSDGAQAGAQYLVIVQDAAGSNGTAAIPTESNLCYINQGMASSGDIHFNVYPKEMKPWRTYYVYLSSNATKGVSALTSVGTFQYYSEMGMVGDVNSDEAVNINDALMMLRYLAAKDAKVEDADVEAILSNILSVGNINRDDTVNINDALLMLRYLAAKDAKISDPDAEQWFT